MLDDTEQWRWIPGYEGRYAVSNRGRVYSYIGKGKYLRASIDGSGRLFVRLFAGSVDSGTYSAVHILIMKAFVGPVPPGQVVRHLNDIATDNRWPENLAYGTQGQNVQDRKWNGVRHGTAKLNVNEVRELRVWWAMGMKRKELAALFNIHEQTLYKIIRGEFHNDVE